MKTHGRTKDAIYKIWCGMIKRCYNPNAGDWHRYGGRGIKVCPRWRHSFENFLVDMGERPSPAHSIDRRKEAKGYNPKNCRWATRQEQADNRASTLKLAFKGRTRTLRAWSEIVGVAPHTLWVRMKYDWPTAKILGKTATIKGVGHGGARLTEQQVSAIRRSKVSSNRIARKYGTTARYIRKIRSGERWSHLNA